MTRAVNLIPAHRFEARRQRRRARQWLACGMLYAVGLVGLCVAIQSLSGGAENALARELTEAEARHSDTAATIDRLHPILVQTQASLFASRSIGSQPDWSLLLDLLASLLDERMILTRVELNPIAAKSPTAPPAGYTLRLSGMALSHEAANDYVLRLEDTRLFDRVQTQGAIKQAFGAGTAVAFHVDCRLAEIDSGGQR